MKGILGRKLGMTQIFTEGDVVRPVSVIQAGPCVVLQRKEEATDGYQSVQLGFDPKRLKRATRPEKGHAKKAEAAPQKLIREIRAMDTAPYQLGDEVTVSMFSVGEFVDVTGTSKGKGFSGTIKRYGHSRGPMSHGSNYHRRPGSLGSIDPQRVFKGQTLPGRMGGRRVTVLNLEIVAVDEDRNLLVVHGTVPGPKRGYVIVRSAILHSEAYSS